MKIQINWIVSGYMYVTSSISGHLNQEMNRCSLLQIGPRDVVNKGREIQGKERSVVDDILVGVEVWF